MTRKGFVNLAVVILAMAIVVAGLAYVGLVRPPTSTQQHDLPSVLDTSEQKTYRNDEYGFEFQYPREWTVQAGDWGITVTTLSDPTKLDEVTVGNSAFFNVGLVRPRPGTSSGPANPSRLPIDKWFNQYFGEGFSATPTITIVPISGRQAVRLQIAEGSGPYVHIYVSNDADVVEISFGLFNPFASHYEKILSTFKFTK